MANSLAPYFRLGQAKKPFSVNKYSVLQHHKAEDTQHPVLRDRDRIFWNNEQQSGIARRSHSLSNLGFDGKD